MTFTTVDYIPSLYFRMSYKQSMYWTLVEKLFGQSYLGHTGVVRNLRRPKQSKRDLRNKALIAWKQKRTNFLVALFFHLLYFGNEKPTNKKNLNGIFAKHWKIFQRKVI